MMDKSLIKIISMTSFITGAVLGLIPLIPPLVWIAFLLVMFAIAPFIIIYLKHLKLIETVETEKSLAIGMLSGSVAFIGFSMIYFPIAFILHLIFKIQSFLWIKTIMVNIGFIIPMVIFTALLCGLMNMFSGCATAYTFEYLRNKNRG